MGNLIAEELPRTGGRGSERLQNIYKATALCVSIKLSLMCLLCGICLAVRGSSTDCIVFLQWGLIAIGLVLMATFITVVKLLRRYKEAAVRLHLLVMFFALLALLSLMIAAFVNINIKLVDDGPPRSTIDDYEALVKPQPVREYSLGDYGGRLRRRVADPRYWARISGCIHHGNACSGMSPLFRDPNTGVFLANRTSNKYPGDAGLSPIESGCCKPPLSCGFTYVNQTTWTVPGVPTNNTDGDCSRWSNDQQNLCFHCDSCKAGVLADVQRAWANTVIFITSFTLLHIILYPFQVKVLYYD
ncbi:hypothetical protein EJB05_23739 [Eragrostis curvula]|uniref:Tetraspanin n=1 Tax=Eragrostis curvula TaxID=38414 RepID=A0A5J9V7P9_9POAL|nr:hypothetical protein EJB05_23739 [Eragrostis curvula]